MFPQEMDVFQGVRTEKESPSIADSYLQTFAEGDTLVLKEVEVFSAPLTKYSFGHQIKSIHFGEFTEFQGMALSDFLQQRTGLFLRQYGPGMLASLTMRGTSAGHNAVFWNGLPINSPSLGQTDFSVLPIGGFDELFLHFGSGGALYGTDAIGGTIHLNSRLKFDQGHQFQFATLLGSFGKWNQQAQYGFSNRKTATRTRVYKNIAENNFPFKNLSKPGTPIEIQENAAVQQLGLSQDFAFQLSDDQLLSSAFWFNQTEREIQPIIGSNTLDEQLDRNLRWVVDYFRFHEQKTWNFKTGLINDLLSFNCIQNMTSQFFLIADLDWEISSLLSSKSGIRYTDIQARLSNYNAKEKRLELYQSTNLRIQDNLKFSLNLRQFIYDGNFAPFTPSLGAEWRLISGRKNEIKLKTTGARSFKIPTLNDRYWEPGGNPELLPESSWSAEFGVSHDLKQKNFRFNQNLTYYNMWVENWIIWLPQGSFWSPDNIREVKNDGLEYFFDFDYNFGLWSFELQGNYNLTRAINQTDISENDRSSGRQLPYTPAHKAQGLFGINRGIWNTYLNYQFTGNRYVGTDNMDFLPAYQLWDCGIKVGELKNSWIRGSIGFQVNNIMDTSYQILRLRAMPGRNYQINIHISL
ncbi:TonB-dependent receptor [Shivajiella indica]|uniref:TonB-dependent receptor n=1 Tax=Shivajiella indica TaxID=872115 RepID=A0ABW5BDJ8_9BACT